MDPRHANKWSTKYLVTWTTPHTRHDFQSPITITRNQSIKDIPLIISRQRTGSHKAAKFIDVICLVAG